jgi:hypothetical protein
LFQFFALYRFKRSIANAEFPVERDQQNKNLFCAVLARHSALMFE